MNNKDAEIDNLRNELTQLKADNINHQQSISDLTLKQLKSDEQIQNLQLKCKELEKKHSKLLSKLERKVI
jgi:predicted  nucleic acid-binding Zn-ribbon protein